MYQFHISNTSIVNGLHNGMNIDMSSAILASICNDNWYWCLFYFFQFVSSCCSKYCVKEKWSGRTLGFISKDQKSWAPWYDCWDWHQNPNIPYFILTLILWYTNIKSHIWTLDIGFVGLAYQGKDIVFRFIIEY
jgi:hypothetical protein